MGIYKKLTKGKEPAYFRFFSFCLRGIIEEGRTLYISCAAAMHSTTRKGAVRFLSVHHHYSLFFFQVVKHL